MTMKRHLLIITFLLAAIGLRAQSSYSCRYWYDDDIANATTTAFSSGNCQAQLDVGDLSVGLHTLHFSLADAMQRWNPAKNFLFMKPEFFDTDNLAYRCWFDEDMESQQTAALDGGAFFLSVDGLSYGLHTVHVLLVGSAFSTIKSYMFLKPEVFDMENLVYHCWFDQDMEHQVVESFSGGSILMDVSELSDGLHTLHFLLEGSAYTTTKSYLFMKVPTNPDGDLHYRCWFNQDVATVQTGDVGSGVFQLEVSALPVGQHSVTVQLDKGTLSSPRQYTFYRGPIITVMANPTEGGTATVQAENNACTLTATPNEGYEFVNWTVNGNVVSTQAVYNFTATGDATYVANFALKTYDITAEANPTAGGTVEGAGVYQHFSTCTLTATANKGYVFVSWNENGTMLSTEPTYSFTVTGDRTLVACFGIPSVGEYVDLGLPSGLLWATCNVGANTPEGYGDYFAWGETQPKDSYSWSTYQYCMGDANTLTKYCDNPDYGYNGFTDSLTILLPEDDAATANWGAEWRMATQEEWQELFDTTTQEWTTQNGVNGRLFTAANGASLFLPIAGYRWGDELFGAGGSGYYWSSSLYTDSPLNAWYFSFHLGRYYVDDDYYRSDGRSVRAVRSAPQDVLVTAMSIPAEGGTVTGAGMYTPGETCTLTATANEGYAFVNWTRNGVVISVEAEYSFTVTEEATFTANFELNSYAITATASPSEGGTVTGGGTYYHFETATLSAIANEGYHFVNWTLGGEVVSSVPTYSFEVTEAADFVAHFAVNAYNVFAMANPSVGGTVSGAGAYDYGETVTLTATPNANYGFVNWTENGVEVSTEASYSFTVEGSRSLVANFDHEYHWNADPFAYESTMTIIGIVQINGEEQLSNLLEVGAFSGEECRGREWLTDQYYVDFGHYLVFLTVYGDNDSADEITFRLYDHAANEEVDKTCVTTLAFETDAIYGSHADPFAINFIDANITQTANLSNGWNWWSSYIELSDNSLEALQSGLGTSGMMIKSQNNGYASYLAGFGWYGSLTTINNENTYQIRASETCTVEMTGSTANPADHPITLSTGWTWVGYPVSTSMTITEALSGITPQNGDMLKSQNDGFASYLDGFGWYGSLSILNPGMGLMYKSNNANAVTLVYPNIGTRTDLKANQTAESNYWQPNLNAYPDNMSVMAVVELDGNELQGENYELAAFANGEVRGSARLLYVEPLNRYMAFLTIAGDEAAELRFSLYNTETGSVETCHGASLRYETNAVMGTFESPYVVSFRSTTGLDEWAGNVNIFPNPVERGQTVSLGMTDVETSRAMSVEIIDALGVVVETHVRASLQGIIAPKVAGIYTLRITVEGMGTSYRKLVVE